MEIPANLTQAQRDGLACVRCGADLTSVASVPVGMVDGGQLFACTSHDDEPVEVPGWYAPPGPVRQDDGMDLVEFLKARLDEDVEHAEGVRTADWENRSAWEDLPDGVVYHARHFDPARVRAEVEAKRRIITMYEDALSFIEMMKERGKRAPGHESAAESYMNVIRAHAAVYRDHPDYRDGWQRP